MCIIHIVDIENIKNLKEYIQRAHGGKGKIKMNFSFEKQKGIGMWNFFAYAELLKGSTVGYHQHMGNDEWYFILSGKAKITIDGSEAKIKKGDCVLTKDGSFHGISEVVRTLKFIAVEVRRQSD